MFKWCKAWNFQFVLHTDLLGKEGVTTDEITYLLTKNVFCNVIPSSISAIWFGSYHEVSQRQQQDSAPEDSNLQPRFSAVHEPLSLAENPAWSWFKLDLGLNNRWHLTAREDCKAFIKCLARQSDWTSLCRWRDKRTKNSLKNRNKTCSVQATRFRNLQGGIKTLDDVFGSCSLCLKFIICFDHVWILSYCQWPQE